MNNEVEKDFIKTANRIFTFHNALFFFLGNGMAFLVSGPRKYNHS